MANQQGNNIRLGLFVIAGIAAIMVAFYLIGANQSLFGSGFKLRVRFAHLSGLTEGDNVLFSGIQAGTVSSVRIINDTTLEATLQIDDEVRKYIHKNALASIGTEGLMGNKAVNIIPGKTTSALVESDDLLSVRRMADIDEMLITLSTTNQNAAVISEGLKRTVEKLNNSQVLNILSDKNVGVTLKSSLQNIMITTSNARKISSSLEVMVDNTRKGRGAVGILLSDTLFADELRAAMRSVRLSSQQAERLTGKMDTLLTSVKQDLHYGKGTLHLLLEDSAAAKNLSATLENTRKGTDGFNQNMEALKHNFLLRGYFKKQEKQKNISTKQKQ